jgi:hypothetical protein
MMTIIGTTDFRGYICTSKGTEIIDEPNPEIPKIKYAPKIMRVANINWPGSIKSKIIKPQPKLFAQA